MKLNLNRQSSDILEPKLPTIHCRSLLVVVAFITKPFIVVFQVVVLQIFFLFSLLHLLLLLLFFFFITLRINVCSLLYSTWCVGRRTGTLSTTRWTR